MKHHLVIPAAGTGERFGAPVAKQYVDLCGAPIIERTLLNLSNLMEFDSISVGLSPQDQGWNSNLAWRRVDGGASRAETVMHLLDSMVDIADDADWVWVHDAVRPFLSSGAVARLVDAMQQGAECIVAGLPAIDTLKRVNAEQMVEITLDRAKVWYAQTPQICRFADIRKALRSCLDQGLNITDEASAMEQAGLGVKMVVGGEDNIKITRPGDLALAESIYTRRITEQCE